MTDRRNNKELIEVVEKTINEKVNGGLDRLNNKLDTHIDHDIQWKNKFDSRMDKLDSRLDIVDKRLEHLKPVSEGLRAFKTIRGGAIYIAGFTTAISAIIIGFIAVIKFIISLIR